MADRRNANTEMTDFDKRFFAVQSEIARALHLDPYRDILIDRIPNADGWHVVALLEDGTYRRGELTGRDLAAPFDQFATAVMRLINGGLTPRIEGINS